ncbi:hypothetical protein [Flagellimonas pelagia]|uniref:Uncharacterized protein n=1 Tax=Flagellimonas pelagia TaxID=2306998 RepID=A0A3A1NKG4_9FLAO|nr:hypothetical protein [Allomuricauda maritima]RIV46476.1 hypothetical protein D2V05_03770 [Allomuricauda maritima]TXJ99137.1 hypothetical protein FQ017_03750 [Allomuricauda maritima]
MTDKKLEGWGLILILVSFGWQFLEVNLTDLSNEVDKYQLHEKVDDLYMIIADAYSNSEFNNSQVRSSVDFETINRNWKYWKGLKREKESLVGQLKWTFYLKSLLFIIGSIFLIIPKFRAIKE